MGRWRLHRPADRSHDFGSISGDLLERPAQNRVAWADVAKGVCIVLVVLWHVIMKHYLQIHWRVSTPFPGAWGTVSEQLLPLRMPLFFTISGFFAAGAVDRPWRVLGRTRVAKFLYLYGLWLLIHTAVLAPFGDFTTEHARTPLELLAQLTITPSNLWYLYALALYFALAKAMRRLPPALVLTAGFALSAVASAGLVATPGDRGGVYQNLVFFLGGLYGKPVIQRLAGTASWPRLAAVGVPYLGMLALIHHFGAKTWFGVWPVTCVVAVFLGVTLAGLATRWARLTNAVAGIGRRTLPIYVLHMPLLAVLHALLSHRLSGAGAGVQLAVALAEPPILTAILVWLCLLLSRILPTPWVFDLPSGGPRRAR
jgi:uncharacterized membrane protein YcfT